jgi:DNA-binding NarL/FixJ family response regulator
MLGDPDNLRVAYSAFDELGASPMLARTAAALRELEVPVPRGTNRSTRDNPHGLTDREVDVLSLLPSGKTNAEIGDALFISPKTAGHHVSRILTKLGASNRAEAAVVAERLGLGD